MSKAQKTEAETLAAEVLRITDEETLLSRVATMTADEANALAAVQAEAWRGLQAQADRGMFGPAVTLGRLIHLGTVADGRKKTGDDVESFGAWGKRHGYKPSTVTLLQTLARCVAHGLTPVAAPESWRHAVQHGTNAQVREALAKNPGPVNTRKAVETLVQADTGTLPKVTRTAQTAGDGTVEADAEKADAPTYAVTKKNVTEAVMLIRRWMEVEGNLSTVTDEDLVATSAHLRDMAEIVEAEGHRRIAARKTGKKATDKHLATAV